MDNKSPLDQPLIVAAYLHGDPSRKRRVKVPPNIKWNDFLALFYSRLDLNPNLEIEIFDEKGIEIVSVDDLVEGDVLVVKERRPKSSHALHSKSRKTDSSIFPSASEHFGSDSMVTHLSHDMGRISHDQSSSIMMGVPGLQTASLQS